MAQYFGWHVPGFTGGQGRTRGDQAHHHGRQKLLTCPRLDVDDGEVQPSAVARAHRSVPVWAERRGPGHQPVQHLLRLGLMRVVDENGELRAVDVRLANPDRDGHWCVGYQRAGGETCA